MCWRNRNFAWAEQKYLLLSNMCVKKLLLYVHRTSTYCTSRRIYFTLCLCNHFSVLLFHITRFPLFTNFDLKIECLFYGGAMNADYESDNIFH